MGCVFKGLKLLVGIVLIFSTMILMMLSVVMFFASPFVALAVLTNSLVLPWTMPWYIWLAGVPLAIIVGTISLKIFSFSADAFYVSVG